MRTIRVVIVGRVQGVGYRAWTVEAAERRGLSGWVRNRRDGSVEAVFSGAPSLVTEMLEACRSGPRLAKVEDIAVTDEAPDSILSGFEARPTI